MTVKELKEQLSRFNDNYLVMMPRVDSGADPHFPYITVSHISQGVNEFDICLFLEDGISCESCAYGDCDLKEVPCNTCDNYTNWREKFINEKTY